MDMNCGIEDIKTIYKGAGNPNVPTTDTGLKFNCVIKKANRRI
jgi:hypothetical protein